VKSGANAGKLVKIAATVCGGGGGGRPDSATAGGKDVTKIDEALAAVVEALKA
jgi:alanyl-tRNA synthetase